MNVVGRRSKELSNPDKTQTDESSRVVELQLVAAVLAKDRKATAEFVSLYADSIYAYVRRRLIPRMDLVDDVVQEVFLAALDSLKQFQATSALRTWLLGIARHKVDDHYRKLFRQPDPLGDDGPDELPLASDEPSVEESLDRARLEDKVRGILEQLPEMYSLALIWRYWERRSAREIAEATGKTEKAVERMLARARAQFKRKWNHE
jgi:RNA polymerase sigma-70 factor (ECF subfamily)